MNIHTSNRAMLVRSVARRNDSFGADTEGFALSSQRKAQITRRNAVSAQEPKKFALSSQRKLSVLLMVGIVILSAKECEMKPMGPGGDKPVPFAYICTNGTRAEGTAEAENTEKCSACNAGFTPNSAKRCVDTTPPAVVTSLTASRPKPLVGTINLSWTEPFDGDFSHVLISWTPDTPDPLIRVNTGTTSTVIAASGLTSGTAYTFTVKSVDTSGLMSANSETTATPVSCSTLFATTTGGHYSPQANVASGSGAAITPYLIPLVNGVDPACPIIIEFNHSAVMLAGSSEYFRIDNLPSGASYTSSTFAWTFKSATRGTDSLRYGLSSDGLINTPADLDIQSASLTKAMDMNVVIDNTDFDPTTLRTVGFYLFNPGYTDSLTLTLTP